MRFFPRTSGLLEEVFGECMAATNLAVSRVLGFRHGTTEVVHEQVIGKRDTGICQPTSEVSRRHRQDSISIRTIDNSYSPKVSATSTLIGDTNHSTTFPKQFPLPLSVEEILTLTKPTIEKLFQDAGSVGASIGVLRHGQHHFLNGGAQGLGVPVLPDQDTVHLISSMSKPIISTAVGILMDDFPRYQLMFDTPVSTVLPELKGSPGILKTYTNQELTIADFLDLRSSFQWMTNLWEIPNGDIPWKTLDPVVSLLQHLPANDSYTSDKAFVYNRNYSNECFALLAAIIERKTGYSWAEFVTKNVLEPLGMHNTFIGLTEIERSNMSKTFAKSHSVQVAGVMPELLQCVDADGLVCRKKVAEWFDRHYGNIPQSVEVRPSQASSAGSVGPSPLAAAAGVMSTTSDLLKFYSKIMDVYDQRREERNSKLLPYPDHLNTPLERGINHLFSHIESRIFPDPSSSTCTYSGGWNTVTVPMTPEERNASPRPRWPGADGDNARRLESGIQSKIHGNDLDYSFFVTKPETQPNVTDINTKTEKPPLIEPSESKKYLALYHGGNMVGATSFCWLLPDHETAVVVLCNTRGFLLDAANLSGMLLAECLFLAESDSRCDTESVVAAVKRACEDTKKMARAIQIDYLYDLARYEHTIALRFRELDPASNRRDTAGLEGRYELTHNVFITITAEQRGLILRLYGTGYGYLLRELREENISKPNGLQKTMTFAQPMAELIPSGVGGTNRLKVDDFVVVFKRGKVGGEWGGFEWNFARDKTPKKRRGYGDTNPYFWRRVKKGLKVMG